MKALGRKLGPGLLALAAGFFNLVLILFPQETIAAAREGLGLWLNTVLPSLLPFVVGANLLSGLGFVGFVGALLEPVMVPLFGVPGCGGFALVTGMTSGYPMGAKITALLRAGGQVTRAEAQRLAGFVNNSGPLFVVGAVGLGLFGSAQVGYFLLAVHYMAALATGFLLKFYGGKPRAAESSAAGLAGALRALRAARKKDGRGFGELLGDSVRNAMETLVTVGGFIILFSVLVRVLELANLGRALGGAVGRGLADGLFDGLFYGLIEMTNGARILADQPFGRQQVALAAAVISFGGLSVHGQSAAFLAKTDLNLGVYLLCKALHGLLAATAAGLLFPLLPLRETAVAVAVVQQHPLEKILFSALLFAGSALGALGVGAVACGLARRGMGKK
jgi:sporulation integral membrane protein YlbJ